MTDTTGDELFDAVTESIARKQGAVARMFAENVQDRVGIDIEHVGNRIIRSRPGEPPRRETGRLQDSITGDAIAQGDIVEAVVYASAPYAADLEKRMRPILSDIADNYTNDFLDAGAAGVEGD